MKIRSDLNKNLFFDGNTKIATFTKDEKKMKPSTNNYP